MAPRAVVTCARGSSDHAATFAKYLIETRLGILTSSAAPSVSSVYAAKRDLARHRASGHLAIGCEPRSAGGRRECESRRRDGRRPGERGILAARAGSRLHSFRSVREPSRALRRRSRTSPRSRQSSTSSPLWSQDEELLEALVAGTHPARARLEVGLEAGGRRICGPPATCMSSAGGWGSVSPRRRP